jgi:AcrR family transcriptional regulator
MSTSAASGAAAPIWARPAPGSRRPRFTRQQIARTGIAIADAEGIDALSMRRLADELGAATMSLYNYVSSKQELFALIEDELLGDVVARDADLPETWRDSLTHLGRSLYGVFRAHPWAATSLNNVFIGPNAMRLFEQTLEGLGDVDLDAQEKIELFLLIKHFVLGICLPTNAADVESMAVTPEVVEYFAAQLDPSEFPNIHAAVGRSGPETFLRRVHQQVSDPERFERGLQHLLDGIAAGLDSGRQARKPALPRRRRTQ